jgi:hypothetical protein
MIPAHQRQEVDRLKTSLGKWALGDVKKALAGGAKVGTFILAAHFIDVLARLAKRKRGDGKAAWDEFVPIFMPDYVGHSDALYRGYRGALSHQYSARGVRFVDTEEYRHRHWTVEGGDRVLHLETFLEQVDAAWAKFVAKVEAEDDFRERVLDRVRVAPLLTVVYDEIGSASVATGFTTVSTSFAAHAATGAPPPGWPGRPPAGLRGFRFEPPARPPAQAIPTSRKRKRRNK